MLPTISTIPGNTSPDSSNDLTKYLLATLVFSPLHDDPYMKVMQAYDATNNELPIPPQAPITLPTVVPPSSVLSLSPILIPRFFLAKEISPPNDIKTPVELPIPISPFSLVGSSSPVRSTTPPPDYPFDKSIFMPPNRTSTSATPTMTQAAIRQLVANSVVAALEAQAATIANTNNPNRNTEPRETL
ncbi:hypothetical protein Tco_0561939 [Tanacetum coccineum]